MATDETIGVAAALTTMTVGGLFVYSAIKGVGVVDLLGGKTGTPLGPSQTVEDSPPQLSPSGAAVGGGAPSLGAPNIGGFGLTILESEANRMIALQLPYKWGGGHAGFDANGPWDCSGAMSWLMHYLGLLTTARPITSTGFMTQGLPGRGQLVTIYANPTHVFLIEEQGSHAGMAWGTTSRFGGEGSLQWHHHTTAGFTPRHYAGY